MKIEKVVALTTLLFLLPEPLAARPSVWNELNDQVVKFYTEGRYAEATDVAKEALDVAEKTFGPAHPHVATSLNNLASLYKLQGNYGGAEPLYQQALAIYEKALGQDHPYVATS